MVMGIRRILAVMRLQLTPTPTCAVAAGSAVDAPAANEKHFCLGGGGRNTNRKTG